MFITPQGYIQEIMEYHIDQMKNRCDNPAYDDKGLSIDPIVNVKTHGDNGRQFYFYTPEVAAAFHNLLVCSLLSYVFCL